MSYLRDIAASSAVTSLSHACHTGGSEQAIAAVLDMDATHAWLQSASKGSKSGATKPSLTQRIDAGNQSFAAHCMTSVDLGFGCI